MDKEKRINILGGLILIFVGVVLLTLQILPGVSIQFSWPWIVIFLGLLFLAFGAALGEPGMAVPASIVAGIGVILYYQNATGNWESWIYLWSLIPGFVGIGIVLMNILQGEDATSMREGGILILISLILFGILGSFSGALGRVNDLWPVLLILLGLRMLIPGALLRRE